MRCSSPEWRRAWLEHSRVAQLSLDAFVLVANASGPDACTTDIRYIRNPTLNARFQSACSRFANQVGLALRVSSVLDLEWLGAALFDASLLTFRAASTSGSFFILGPHWRRWNCIELDLSTTWHVACHETTRIDRVVNYGQLGWFRCTG